MRKNILTAVSVEEEDYHHRNCLQQDPSKRLGMVVIFRLLIGIGGPGVLQQSSNHGVLTTKVTLQFPLNEVVVLLLLGLRGLSFELLLR
jgi:hypothetical protein